METSYVKLLKNINLAFLRYVYSLNIFYFNRSSSIIILDRYLSETVNDINGPRSNINFNSSLFKNSYLLLKFLFIKIKKHCP